MRARIGLVAPLAALSLALTACGPSEASEAGEALSGAPSASQQHSVGDVVDETAAQGLDSFSTDKNGAYGMPDGSFIVVHADEPLPSAVRSDMERRVAELTPATDHSDSPAAQESASSFARLAAELSASSKKTVIIFTLAVSPSTGVSRWVHYGGSVSERIPAAEDLTGDNLSMESYVDEVFEKSREDYFEVFYE